MQIAWFALGPLQMPLQVLIGGVLLGFAAGISPGPLMGLVISETLRRGRRAGSLVALAPLITDLPLIALSLGLSFTALTLDTRWMPALLSLAGAVFLGWLGFSELLSRSGRDYYPDKTSLAAEEAQADECVPQSATGALAKGALINLLSPHPWLFWLTVGGPLIISAGQSDRLAAISFPLTFLSMLVGCKLLIVWLCSFSSHWISGRAFWWLLRLLGVLYLVYAGLLLVSSIQFFVA
ncbi:MAG: LysE family translocator [Leptospiraceae bacterium]|nr:LysE family translocator [Leptospiraceae bacterium]